MFSDARRYIAIQAGFELISNMAVNAAISWYWTRGIDHVQVWGWPGVAVDLIPTGLGIGIFLTLVLTWRLHRRLRAGTTLPAVVFPGRLPRIVHGLPLNPWYRGAIAGAAGIAAALLILLVLQVAGIEKLGRVEFTALKAIFAGIVAFTTMLVAGFRALGDGVTPQQPRGYWPER